VVSIGSEERLERELKFWVNALQMKKIAEFTGADGFKSTVIGFGDDDKGFGIEFKMDPSILKRKQPSILNYAVMQPYVDALNFVQVGSKDKIVDVFGRVQANGGNALIGDESHVDVESPRGVQVRIVTRETEPSVELVSFNVEVPAFDAVTKFYKRSFGMQEFEYPPEEPMVQKLSVLLGSDSGPNLLLCPTPDGRLKERDLDAFENVVVVANDPSSTVSAAQKAVELNKQEDAEKEEQLKVKLAQLPADRRSSLEEAVERRRSSTLAKPKVMERGSFPLIDDGVGNLVIVASQADISKTV